MSDHPSRTFFDANARVETLIYIPGAVADIEALPETFEDFCENLPEKADHPLYAQCQPLAQFAEAEDYPEPEAVAEALLWTNGFLVQAATPVRHYQGGGAYGYSWGHYYTAWLYAAAEADIVPVVCQWAATRAAHDEAKAAAA